MVNLLRCQNKLYRSLLKCLKEIKLQMTRHIVIITTISALF